MPPEPASASPFPFDKFRQRLRIGTAGDPLFGDDRADQAMGGDIKSRMSNRDLAGGNLLAQHMGDFPGGSLFDRNLLARGAIQINRRGWGGHIETAPCAVRPARRTLYVPILLATSPLAAVRSVPTITQSIAPCCMKWPIILSVIRVARISSRTSFPGG